MAGFAFKAVMAGTLMLFQAARAQGTISISVKEPKAGESWFGYIFFVAEVASTFEIKSVVARCGDSSMSLDYGDGAFRGKVVLAPSAQGSVGCSVRAEDVLGGSASADVQVDINRPPRLAIEEPDYAQAVLPGSPLRLKMKCLDDDTCAIDTYPKSFHSLGSLDTVFRPTVDSAVSLIQAKDKHGNTENVALTYVFLPTGRFTIEKRVHGQILDVQGSRFLFWDGYRKTVGILDSMSGKTDTIPYDFQAAGAPKGWLRGDRVFLAFAEASHWTALEVSGSRVLKVAQAEGSTNEMGLVDAYPGFALWESLDGAYFRDFRTDAVIALPRLNEHTFQYYALTREGRIYHSGRQSDTGPDLLFELRDGKSEMVDTCSDPLADGDRVLCLRRVSADSAVLLAREGDSTRRLASGALAPSGPWGGPGVTANGGWTGVLRPSGLSKSLQLYLIDSTGTERKATFFNSDVSPIALCPNGDAVVRARTSGDRIYWLRQGREPFEVMATYEAHPVCGDGTPSFLDGNALLRADTLPTSLVRKANRAAGVFPRLVGNRLELDLGADRILGAELFCLTGARVRPSREIVRSGGKLSWDLSGMRRGVYFVSVATSVRKWTSRIVLD